MAGLFTDYIYRKFIPEEQAARARRGVAPSGLEVEASTAQYFARPAMEQARSNILGGIMGLARRSLKSRATEFDKRLALSRRASDLRTKLGEEAVRLGGEQLKDTERYLRRSNRMFPVNVGLGAANIGLGYYQGREERKRADELMDIYKKQQEQISGLLLP